MTNQTKPGAMVAMSRQLAELLFRNLNGGDNQLCGMEHGAAFRELKALLNTEQPPAVGGEPETVAWLDLQKLQPGGMAYATQMKVNHRQTELIDRSHVAPLLAELEFQKKIKEGNFKLVLEQLDEIRALKARIAELEAGQGQACATLRVEALDGKPTATVARFDIDEGIPTLVVEY